MRQDPGDNAEGEQTNNKSKGNEEKTRANQGEAVGMQEKGGQELVHQKQLLLNALLAQISQGNFLPRNDANIRAVTSVGQCQVGKDSRVGDGGKKNPEVWAQVKHGRENLMKVSGGGTQLQRGSNANNKNNTTTGVS